MSWISTNNLRRFADNLFHGKLSFSGNVTHNGAVEFNGGVKVNTVKAEFTAPVSFTGTTTYKGNEIATKAMLPTQNSQLENDSGYLSPTSSEIQELRAAMASIPTKTSQLTNDSGYVNYSDGKALEVGNYLDLHDNNNMDVDYTFRILGNGQIERGNGAYIQVLDSGHLNINGNELWIE